MNLGADRGDDAAAAFYIYEYSCIYLGADRGGDAAAALYSCIFLGADRGDDAAAAELELDHGPVEEAGGLEPVGLDAPHKRGLPRTIGGRVIHMLIRMVLYCILCMNG